MNNTITTEEIILEPTFVWHNAIKIVPKINEKLNPELKALYDYQGLTGEVDLYITSNLEKTLEEVVREGKKPTNGVFVNLKRDTAYKIYAVLKDYRVLSHINEITVSTAKQMITPRDIINNLEINPGLVAKIKDEESCFGKGEILLNPVISFCFNDEKIPVRMDFKKYLDYVCIDAESAQNDRAIAVVDFERLLDDSGFADVLALFENLLKGTGLELPADNPRAIYHLFRALRERSHDFFYSRVDEVVSN